MAIEIQGMAPLLQVYDMAASIAFYCDVLGRCGTHVQNLTAEAAPARAAGALTRARTEHRLPAH